MLLDIGIWLSTDQTDEVFTVMIGSERGGDRGNKRGKTRNATKFLSEKCVR